MRTTSNMAATMARPYAFLQKLISKSRQTILLSQLNSYVKCRALSFLSSSSYCRPQEKTREEIDESFVPPLRSDFVNRNPRDKEYQGFGKPRGYSTQFNRRDYYNKLCFIISNRHIKAFVQHNSGTVLASALTTEFPIARHLYKTTDAAAALNIGRVLAQRCMEAGLTRVYWAPQWTDKKKLRVKAFTSAIQKGGVKLTEPKAVMLRQDFYSDFKPRKLRKRWKRMPESEKRKMT